MGDTTPNLPLPSGARYRTFIRISFEDEQQRQRPATCWQLWKEGRGTNEAHQRGGKLQAVEYVEANQPAENDDKRTRVDIDTASFDGFSVIWTPGAIPFSNILRRLCLHYIHFKLTRATYTYFHEEHYTALRLNEYFPSSCHGWQA